MSEWGEMTRAEKWLNKRVRAFYASDREQTHGKGTVVAYTDAPTVEIEETDGSRFSWRADLCETVPDPRAEDGPETSSVIVGAQLADAPIVRGALVKKAYSDEDLKRIVDAALALEMKEVVVRRVGRSRAETLEARGLLIGPPPVKYEIEMVPA